jgi:hypothetical protein
MGQHRVEPRSIIVGQLVAKVTHNSSAIHKDDRRRASDVIPSRYSGITIPRDTIADALIEIF